MPQPYQQPFPPIRVAAASEETFPSLGEAGYPIFVAVRSGSLSGLAPDLAAYRRAYREAGHPGEGEVYLRLTLHIADTDARARDEAEESIMYGYRTLSTRLENSPNRRRAAEAATVRTIFPGAQGPIADMMLSSASSRACRSVSAICRVSRR